MKYKKFGLGLILVIAIATVVGCARSNDTDAVVTATQLSGGIVWRDGDLIVRRLEYRRYGFVRELFILSNTKTGAVSIHTQ